MAARPNTLRTLQYGKRIAENHIERIHEMIRMAEDAIANNALLSAKDVQAYKACVKTGKVQLRHYERIAQLELPVVKTARKRRRGRPTKAALRRLETDRKKAK